MGKWTFWQEPVEKLYRIREELDGGENHRIVGFVAKAEDAKLICDVVNESKNKA